MKRLPATLFLLAGLGILGVCIAFIFTMNEERQRKMTCAGLQVEFADQRTFVTREDIEGYLKKEYGAYIGQRLDSVDLKKVEQILDSKSAIRKTEAFTTPDGYLNVIVYQREPFVRFQKGAIGFFADEKGFLFPLQRNFASTVPIIDGAVPLDFSAGFKGEPKSESQKQWLAAILSLVSHMNKCRVWAKNIAQITVEGNGDLVLVPRQGKERFLFGKPVEIGEKFARIEKYYSAILPEKGAGYYSTVNVKYHKQIVCRK